MNAGTKIVLPPSVNSLLGGRMISRGQENFISMGWEAVLEANEPQVGH